MVNIPNTNRRLAINGLNIFRWSLIYSVQSPRASRTGRVPRANHHITIAHCQALCDERANIIMLWVNPQGRRNVITPTHGEYFGFFSLVIFRDSETGRWKPHREISGRSPRSWIPRYARINPTTILRNPLKYTEEEKVCPIIPRIKPQTVKVINRPKWKRSCVFHPFVLSTMDSVYPIIIPHVRARQVDTDATRPTKKAIPNPSFSYVGINPERSIFEINSTIIIAKKSQRILILSNPHVRATFPFSSSISWYPQVLMTSLISDSEALLLILTLIFPVLLEIVLTLHPSISSIESRSMISQEVQCIPFVSNIFEVVIIR